MLTVPLSMGVSRAEHLPEGIFPKQAPSRDYWMSDFSLYRVW